jgi:uncharacterized protein (DUF2384 family)
MTSVSDRIQTDLNMNAAVSQAETFEHRLIRHAREVFSDDAKAEIWLHWEIPALGYRKPLDMAQTQQGFDEADAVLTRIESGSY